MKIAFLFLSIAFHIAANPFMDFSAGSKIAVQNSILAKVNGTTISMMDVKKKMDVIFHQSYPHLSDSNQARFQFYQTSWRPVLMDMIDQQLIISDALDKEFKLTDGDIRQALEERFGPRVMQTLDKIGLTYEEAWNMVKNDLIVQQMNWSYIQNKAVKSVTPQDLRQAYRLYLSQNPSYSEWKYHVISIRMEEADDMLCEKIYQTFCDTNLSPLQLEDTIKKFETANVSISISKEFQGKTQDLSEIHRNALESLEVGLYSKPSLQLSKSDKKSVYRIFYVVDKTDHPAPAFEVISSQLRNDLIQKAIVQESQGYLGKLRKHYGFDMDKTIPENLHPFSLQ